MIRLILSALITAFLTILIVGTIASVGKAAEFRLLDLDYMDMRAAKFGANRDLLTPDIPQDQYRGRVATDFQIRLCEVGYWQNRVHAEGTEGKFQTVGWHWELGLRITDQIAVFHEHHSRHRMDSSVPDLNADGRPDKFPVEDSYGLRFRLYFNPRPERSLINW